MAWASHENNIRSHSPGLFFGCSGLPSRILCYSLGEEHMIVRYSERMIAQFLLEAAALIQLHAFWLAPRHRGIGNGLKHRVRIGKRATTWWGLQATSLTRLRQQKQLPPLRQRSTFVSSAKPPRATWPSPCPPASARSGRRTRHGRMSGKRCCNGSMHRN